ncbi:MAG TPA: carboxypeptidase regulatory-like domain-containing protein [Polyangiaceae bacterium]|nr:carboxypeptidase regulatory-like domain-containing protein [Polyangiaceae bacterium]
MRASPRFLCLFLGLAILASCSKKKTEDDDDEPTTESPKKAAAEKTIEKAEAPSAGSGSVTGTIAFAGKAPEAAELPRKADPVCAAKPMKSNEVVVNGNGTLKDVLVRIAPGSVKGKFPADGTVSVKQEDCMYVPRVQGAVAGQVVSIENTDKTMHNVHTYKGQETILNQGQPAGSPPIKKDNVATEAAVLKFKCDVHPWMTGYLIVTDHPFFQTTGTDGAFKLDKVPAGKYTIEAWHSKYGVKTAQVTVEPNKNAEIKFSYDGTEKGE